MVNIDTHPQPEAVMLRVLGTTGFALVLLMAISVFLM